MKNTKYFYIVFLFFIFGTPSYSANPSEETSNCKRFLSIVTNFFKPKGSSLKMNREYFDLTLPISKDILRFPGDPAPEIITEDIPFGGSSLTMSHFKLGAHIGTHVDAPSHFIKDALNMDQLPLDLFIGEVYVLDLSTYKTKITSDDLKKIKIPDEKRVFIKTANSASLTLENYKEDHVYLTFDAADYLISKGIQLLGFDYYNIDGSQNSTLVSHTAFARANIPVIVALNMSKLKEGRYFIGALPLYLKALEASPVRVVVWRNNGEGF